MSYALALRPLFRFATWPPLEAALEPRTLAPRVQAELRRGVTRFREIPPSLRGEIKVAGLESVRALFSARPRDITRVYVIERMQQEIRDILAWCERNDIEWYEVTVEELAAFAETMHHDGMCIVARKKAPTTLSIVDRWAETTRGAAALVLLDGVKNPNNLGAVARTCAYFGVPYLLAAGDSAGYSQAAVRVAQGATETVNLVQVTHVRALSSLKDFTLVTSTSHDGARLDTTPLPARSIVCLGGENAGISPEIAALDKAHITIPGAGGIESLNLAQATALLLWEHWRVHRTGDSKPAPQSTAAKKRTPRH